MSVLSTVAQEVRVHFNPIQRFASFNPKFFSFRYNGKLLLNYRNSLSRLHLYLQHRLPLLNRALVHITASWMTCRWMKKSRGKKRYNALPLVRCSHEGFIGKKYKNYLCCIPFACFHLFLCRIGIFISEYYIIYEITATSFRILERILSSFR